MTKVSIIMSTYKEPVKWIQQAVNSILNQTYKNLEIIIVVDNPEYYELILLLHKYADFDKRISVVINKCNIGLVKSLNKALSYCTGDFIARMDADDISLPERIERQIDYLNRQNYDLVGCFYEVFCENKVLRIAKGAAKHEVCAKILQYESCAAHPAWMARKKVFDDLGGYRDFDACEDYDFLIRAVLGGYKIGNVPEVLLRYRDNPNSISHEKSGKQYSITQLLASNYREGKCTNLEEYQEYLNSSQYNRVQKTYIKISTIDRKRYLSDNNIEKILCLSRLVCYREFRRMKIVRRKINRWKRFDN